jgi:DNA-binding protein HU-beta
MRTPGQHWKAVGSVKMLPYSSNKKVAEAMMEGLSETAIAQVKRVGLFILPGIGRLVRVDRKARMGRNPATGETIKIPAKKVVKFRVAKAAKEAIVPTRAKKATA